MFKQCSEKSSDQKVPTSGGKAQPPAHTFWSVQVAISEFSAGQWQAKRLLDEKMYFDTQDPPASFLFKAFQDASFNLQILVFYTSSSSELSVTNWEGGGPWGDTESFDVTILVAQGTLGYPDAPLSIVQIAPAPAGSSSLPGVPLVDLSQEPTYSLITIGLPTNVDLDAAQLQYTPIDFSYKGQDLV